MNSMRKLLKARGASLPRLWFLAVLCGVFLGGAAYAQAPGADQERLKSVMQARQHLEKVERRLTRIQQATISTHPELQKQQSQFESLLMSTMRDKGYKPKEDMKRLTELREKLRAGGMRPKERSQAIAEFQQKSSRLQKGQQEALQDKKVIKARQALEDAVVAAMKKKDPSTANLLKDMDETKRKLDKLQGSSGGGY